MIEPMSASLKDKWGITKEKAVGIMCICGFILSIGFTMGNGLHLLDIFDHFIANFGLVIIGLVECIIFGWLFAITKLRAHANNISDFKIGRWWEILIKYVIPIVLGVILVLSIIDNITKPYNDYPWWIILTVGIIPVILLFVFSFILTRIKEKEART
jgi:NSS family neurotransmitter:Na+ symporter